MIIHIIIRLTMQLLVVWTYAPTLLSTAAQWTGLCCASPGNDQSIFGVVRHFVGVGATLRCCSKLAMTIY